MKSTIALLVSAFAIGFAAPPRAELAQVHKVYLLPMTNGMDQYLANRLTSLGVFQVVTDPKKADAIFTDRLGEAFEARQSEWFPEAAKPIVEQAAALEAPAVAPTPAPPGQAAPPAAPAAETPASPAAPAPTAPVQTADKQSVPPPPAPPKPAPAAKEADKQNDRGLKGDKATPPTTFHRTKGILFLVDPRTRQVLWSTYAQPKSSSSVEMDRTADKVASRILQELKGH